MGLDLQLPCLSAAPPLQSYPYESSISSSASSSSSSVFSVDAASSQDSDCTSVSVHLSQELERTHHTDSKASACTETQVPPCARRELPPICTDVPPPPHQRQHPRRSSTVPTQRPPALVRQCERKVNFVDNLVDTATQIVEVIWPLSVPSCREGPNGRGVLPLRTFIQETLRRSRTSYSTLQVALYYLILIKPRVPKHDFTMEQPEDAHSLRALQCGRRMFLAALILASKYLQDRNYSARAWSKISGLKVSEININEMAFLEAVDWKLHIVDDIFERWREIVLQYTPSNQSPPSPGSPTGMPLTSNGDWKSIIPLLTPQLDTVPIAPKTHCLVQREPTLPRAATISLADLSMQPATAQKLPRFLEPKTDILPPTPSVPRMGPLPTPQMTPQSIASSTPAAGSVALGSRRPSMCSAMAQAQSVCMARTALDTFNPYNKATGLDTFQFPGRRPSVAPSISSRSSSPESMVSDSSSRSSRASSISSVSSVAWAPNAAKLARLATCRNAKLPYSAHQYCPKEATLPELQCLATSEPMSSPDFENFRLSDPEPSVLPLPVRSKPTTVQEVKKASPEEAESRSRKRGRSSVDLSLQQNVRHLLNSSRSYAQLQSSGMPSATILPDRSIANSFLFSGSEHTPDCVGASKALQSPSTMPDGRLPVQKDLGRKRACCASEAVMGMRRPGPGMWEGIL